MLIKTLKVWKNGRNYLNGQPLAHIIWNYYNPNNKFRQGFSVHHKDGDKLNDHISNLELLSFSEHAFLHKKGSFHKEESKKKMSENTSREKHPLYGKHHSEETKKKMSEAKKGIFGKDHPRFGLPGGMLGKKHTKEAKEKMSNNKIGIKRSEEVKRKISETKKGKPGTIGFPGRKHSEGTKKKISEAAKKRR